MKDSLKTKLIHGLSLTAVLVAVFLDLGAAFLAFPLLILYVFDISETYSEYKGTISAKLAKTTTFITVHLAILIIFAWFLSFATIDYFHVTWWNYLFSLSGIKKFLVFLIFLAACSLVYYVGKVASDAIIQVAIELFKQAQPWLKRRILYFVALYIFIVMFFGTFYHILYVFNSSFFSVSENIKPVFHDFLYFSAATMATLGSSDISPASFVTKCAAVLQIFLTVFVLMVYLSYVFSNSDQRSNNGSS